MPLLLLLLPACGPGAPGGEGCDVAALDKHQALERVIDGLTSDCEVAWYLSVLDDLAAGRQEGPWVQDLWVMESPDARRFDVAGSTRLGTGAVPEAVRGPDGRIYLYFLEGDLDHARERVRTRSPWFREHGLSGFGALDAWVSDDGLHFEPLEGFRVLSIVRGMVADPDVVRLPDGTWRMYYVGLPVGLLDPTGRLDRVTPRQAFYADSRDLVTWQQVGVAADGPGADPTVACFDPARCLMVSTGLDYATSTDGGATFAFRKAGDPSGFAPEAVALPGGSVRVLYNSMRLTGPVDAMVTADGGATWTPEVGLVPGCQVEAMSLLPRPEGGFLAYYHYWKHGLSGSDFGEHAGDPAFPDPCDEAEDPRR